jgi:hypothetical protein
VVLAIWFVVDPLWVTLWPPRAPAGEVAPTPAGAARDQ